MKWGPNSAPLQEVPGATCLHNPRQRIWLRYILGGQHRSQVVFGSWKRELSLWLLSSRAVLRTVRAGLGVDIYFVQAPQGFTGQETTLCP